VRRLTLAGVACVLIALFLLASPGCKRRRRPAQRTDEPMFSSMASAADPREAVQFRKGFYDVEANSWRWTAKHFQVALSPPRRHTEKGVELVLRFALPDVIIKTLNSIQLSAAINGLQLPPQTYRQSGDLAYVQDVPADKLSSGLVLVDFDLDKALPATATDNRELGIIVSQVGLIAK
jgi:hypothetical protein